MGCCEGQPRPHTRSTPTDRLSRGGHASCGVAVSKSAAWRAEADLAKNVALPRRESGFHSGFTLVELLVVIAIIGVLVGLLVVALGRAQVAVREAAVATEVQRMSQALQAFKTQYQVEFPPDFAYVPASGVDPNSYNADLIDRYMQRIFRYRRTGGAGAANLVDAPIVPNSGMAARMRQGYRQLDAAEALVFWLGGFTNDPEYPLCGNPSTYPQFYFANKAQPGPERTPLFEFDKERLRDNDNDGFYEYYPPFGDEMPYVYYNKNSYDEVTQALYMAYASGSPQVPQLRVAQSANQNYLISKGKFPPMPTMSIENPDPSQLDAGIRQKLITANDFAAPDTFQIIAAGLDNTYAPAPNTTIQSAAAGYVISNMYPLGPYAREQRDNITNFVERTLEGAIP